MRRRTLTTDAPPPPEPDTGAEAQPTPQPAPETETQGAQHEVPFTIARPDADGIITLPFASLPHPLPPLPDLATHPTYEPLPPAGLGLTRPESFAQWRTRCHVHTWRFRVAGHIAILGVRFLVPTPASATLAFPRWYSRALAADSPFTTHLYLRALVSHTSLAPTWNLSACPDDAARHLADRIFLTHRDLFFHAAANVPRRTIQRLAATLAT